MRQQLQARNDKKGWKSDPVEDAGDGNKRQDRAGEKRRATLHTNISKVCSFLFFLLPHGCANLVLNNATDQHQTPSNQQRLEGVGEGVRLISPGDVRGCDQHHSCSALARGGHQLIDGPVLQYEAQQKHDPPEEIKNHIWRRMSRPELGIEPFQQAHGHIVDGP